MAGRMPGRGLRKPSQVKNMQELMRLINQQRTSMGLPPVSVGSGPSGVVVMETSAPRPKINISEQPPFPVGLEDPSKPLREQDLFHGSNSLHYALQPDNTAIDWNAEPPPAGTDMAGYLDPSKAAMEGHLGPAALYSTSNEYRASMFGSNIYKPTINADYSDFIGVNRRAMRPYGGQFARVQRGPSLLQGLASQYGDRVGHKMPSDITLAEFNENIAKPTITQYLLDNNVDVDRVNALLDENHRMQGMLRGPATYQLQDYAFFTRGFVPERIEPILERGGMAKGDGYGWQSLDAAHQAGKRAVQDSIVGSGAVGLTERYPNDPMTGQPQQHFAVYNKNAIESLIKLGLMLGAIKAGSNATASGTTEE